MAGGTTFTANTDLNDTVPATGSALVTPNDSVDLPRLSRALLIGVAGTMKVTMADGSIDTLPVTVGYNPLQVKRVWAASLTADDIHALY